MNKFLLLGLFFGTFMSHLQGQSNRQSLFDKSPEDPSLENISSEYTSLSKITFEDDEKKWKIGGLIHFEEKSSPDYLGTIEIIKLTRESLKGFFDIKSDSCSHNAKTLIKKEDDYFVIKHREERNNPGIGEEMHATLLYTSKRVDNGHETLKDVYQKLTYLDNN